MKNNNSLWVEHVGILLEGIPGVASWNEPGPGSQEAGNSNLCSFPVLSNSLSFVTLFLFCKT